MHYCFIRVMSVFVLVLLLLIITCDVTYGVRDEVELTTNDTISDNHTYHIQEEEELYQQEQQQKLQEHLEIMKLEGEAENRNTGNVNRQNNIHGQDNSNSNTPISTTTITNDSIKLKDKNKEITKYIRYEDSMRHVHHQNVNNNAEKRNLLHEYTSSTEHPRPPPPLQEMEEVELIRKTRSLSAEDEIALYGAAMRALYVESNLSLFVEHVQHGAVHGHGRLQWLLGVLHANGVGVCKNATRALEHFKEAAQRGIPEAATAVAKHLYNTHAHDDNDHHDHQNNNDVNSKTKTHGTINEQNTAAQSNRRNIADLYFHDIGDIINNSNNIHSSDDSDSVNENMNHDKMENENRKNNLENQCKESLPYYRLAALHVLQSYSPLYIPSHAPFPDKFHTTSFSVTRVINRVIRVLQVVYTHVIVFVDHVLPRLLLHSVRWLAKHILCKFRLYQYVEEYMMYCYQVLYDTIKPVYTFINSTYSKHNNKYNSGADKNKHHVGFLQGSEYTHSNVNRHPLRPTFTNEVMHQRHARLQRHMDKYSRNKREEKLDIEIYKADSGNTRSMIHLGYDYLFGRRGVKKDWRESKKFFERALNKGDSEAWVALGLLYLLGDPTTTPPLNTNIELARYYFMKGAEQHSASALDALGYLHEAGYLYNGEIVDKELLESTQIQKHATTKPTQNPENTKQKTHTKSASSHEKEGQINKGESFLNTSHFFTNHSHYHSSSSFRFKQDDSKRSWQRDFTPDYHTALKYYIGAFQLMSVNTMYHFGKFALHGHHGVEQNPVAAEHLFEVMASRDQPLAMWELGQIYEHREECDNAVKQYDTIISLAPWYNTHSPTSNLITADWLDYDDEVVLKLFRENQLLEKQEEEEREEKNEQEYNDAVNLSNNPNTMEFTKEDTNDSNWQDTHSVNSTHSHNEASNPSNQHKLEHLEEEEYYVHHVKHQKGALPRSQNIFAEIKFEAEVISLRELLNHSETFTILINSSKKSSETSSSSHTNEREDSVHNSHFTESVKTINNNNNVDRDYVHKSFPCIPRYLHAALQDKIREEHHIRLLQTRKLILENVSTQGITEEEETESEDKEMSKTSSLPLSHVMHSCINTIRKVMHWCVNQFLLIPLRTLIYSIVSQLHRRFNALFSILPQSWSWEWSLYSAINPPTTTFNLFSRNGNKNFHSLHQHTQTQTEPFSSPFSPLALPTIEYSVYDTPLVWFVESLSMAATGHAQGINNVIDILNNLVFVTGEKERLSDEYMIASLLQQENMEGNSNTRGKQNMKDNIIADVKEYDSAQYTDQLVPFSGLISDFAFAPNIYIDSDKQDSNALFMYLSSFMNEETILLHWTTESAMELVNSEHIHNSNNITLQDAEGTSRLLSQREAKALLMVQHLMSNAFKDSHVARLVMGDIYFYGISLLLGKNITKALEMYTYAAKLNEPEALFKLGLIYQLGLNKAEEHQSQHLLQLLQEEEQEHDRELKTTNKWLYYEKAQHMPQSIMEILWSAILRIIYHRPYASLSDLQVSLLSFSKMKSVYAESWLLGQASLILVNFQWWWMHFALQPHGLWELYKLNMPFSDYVMKPNYSNEHSVDGFNNNISNNNNSKNSNNNNNSDNETIWETQQTYNHSSQQVRLKRPFQLALNVHQIRLATTPNETTHSYDSNNTNTNANTTTINSIKTKTFFGRTRGVNSVQHIIKLCVTLLWTRCALLVRGLMHNIRLFVKYQWNMVVEPFLVVWHFVFHAAHLLLTEISLAAIEMYTFILSLTLLVVTLFILHYYG